MSNHPIALIAQSPRCELLAQENLAPPHETIGVAVGAWWPGNAGCGMTTGGQNTDNCAWSQMHDLILLQGYF